MKLLYCQHGEKSTPNPHVLLKIHKNSKTIYFAPVANQQKSRSTYVLRDFLFSQCSVVSFSRLRFFFEKVFR